ncbi:hypothetical protein BC628DRAFT_510863 [Trametes gibbosa]|nr:hypothetical protein BC628DRAFT_510863 [Trametes gibbosa]
MPHRREPSAGTCEIVPAPDQLPCAQRGFGDRPRLCGTHRKEYSSTTAAYKATSEEAEALYLSVRARDWKDTALWNLANVEEALRTATSCVETINREIRERQEHHRRFFTERTLCTVSLVQFVRAGSAGADVAMRDPVLLVHDGHEGWITKLRKKLREVEDIATQLRNCKAALTREERLREEEERLHQERRHRADAARASQRAWSSRASTTAQQTNGHNGTSPAYATHEPMYPMCIAYVADWMEYGGHSRCTQRALYRSRCQQHEQQYLEASASLKKAKDNSYTISTVTDHIADVSEYIQLSKTLEDLRQRINRLNGSLSSVPTDTTTGIPQCVVEGMRDSLKSIHSELLMSKPTVQPVRYGSTYNHRTPEGTKREARPRETYEGSGSWVATTIGLAIAGVAMFMGFRR